MQTWQFWGMLFSRPRVKVPSDEMRFDDEKVDLDADRVSKTGSCFQPLVFQANAAFPVSWQSTMRTLPPPAIMIGFSDVFFQGTKGATEVSQAGVHGAGQDRYIYIVPSSSWREAAMKHHERFRYERSFVSTKCFHLDVAKRLTLHSLSVLRPPVPQNDLLLDWLIKIVFNQCQNTSLTYTSRGT